MKAQCLQNRKVSNQCAERTKNKVTFYPATTHILNVSNKQKRMKNKILVLITLIGLTNCTLNQSQLIIDPNIKRKVESQIKKSEYGDMEGLLIYNTPKIINFYVDDSLSMSENGKNNDLFKSFYYQKNDTISIDGAFGLFGGYGFSIKIKDDKVQVYTLMAADEIPIYSLTETDSLKPVSYTHLTLPTTSRV